MRRPGLGSNTGRAGPRRATGCVAGALAVLAVTAACSSNTPAPPPPPTAPVAPFPAPVPATLQQQLTDAVTRYQTVYDSVYNNPHQDLSVVDTVATGQEATSLKYQAKQVADQHIISSGAIKVLRAVVVTETPNPPITSQPAMAIVKACIDVSATTGTTPDGKSVVDPKRLPQTQETLTLTTSTPEKPSAWLVSKVESGAALPCDPS